MFKRFGMLAGALGVALALAGGQAGTVSAAPRLTYSYQKIASPQDRTFTQLLGINNNNTIAGYFGSGNAGHPNRGFTLVPPAWFTTENFPGSVQTQVIAINGRGDTAGFFVDAAGVTHGFIKARRGAFRTVDLPGTKNNQVLGLDDFDRAAGFFTDAGGMDHAWIRDNFGDFIVPPIMNSQATGINDNGMVVGFTQKSQNVAQGFLWRGTWLKFVSVPGSMSTQILGENNRGMFVGQFNDFAGNTHGFVFDGRQFRVVNVPGAMSTTVNGINDRGQIVGFFTDAAGNTVGFIGNARWF